MSVAPGPDVELIPPGRPALQRMPQPDQAPTHELALAALPLTALSLGFGVAMMPVFATMFVMLVPMRWLLGGSGHSQRAGRSQ